MLDDCQSDNCPPQTQNEEELFSLGNVGASNTGSRWLISRIFHSKTLELIFTVGWLLMMI